MNNHLFDVSKIPELYVSPGQRFIDLRSLIDALPEAQHSLVREMFAFTPVASATSTVIENEEDFLCQISQEEIDFIASNRIINAIKALRDRGNKRFGSNPGLKLSKDIIEAAQYRFGYTPKTAPETPYIFKVTLANGVKCPMKVI